MHLTSTISVNLYFAPVAVYELLTSNLNEVNYLQNFDHTCQALVSSDKPFTLGAA